MCDEGLHWRRVGGPGTLPFWCHPTGHFFCARSFVPSESPIVCDSGLHWRRVGTPGILPFWWCPTASFMRASVCVQFCVFVLICVRSACCCLSKESLDIAVPFLKMPAAGLLCCALSFCSLFSQSQPSLLVSPFNFSGNDVFGIKPSILGACRRCRRASSACVRTFVAKPRYYCCCAS